MSHTILLRTAALALAVSTALAYAAPPAGKPHLRHASAPFVGQTLTLAVEGAVPNAPIELYFSPESASYATPFGQLELRRDRMVLLGRGRTTALGLWSFDLAVPLDESLAETGAHFQAVVAAPGGKVFSDAVHARFLGPRVYAGYRSHGSPHSIGMYVVSAVTDAVVAQVDYGTTDAPWAYHHEGKPVFDAVYSRGAVMGTEHDLVFFDPFFGGVQSRIVFAAPCSRLLLTDSDARSVYVLELAAGPVPARIHAIDLASASETAHLDLPNAVDAIWCGGAGEEAFVAEHDLTARTAVRHVGLDPLTDLGATAVGTPSSRTFVELVYASGQAFAATLDSSSIPMTGSLSRCRATSTGFGARVTELGPNQITRLTPVLAADRLIAQLSRTDLGPAFVPCEVPLSSSGPPVAIVAPQGSGEFSMVDIEADGPVAWVVSTLEFQHSQYLFRLDVPSHAWTQYPFGWPSVAPAADATVLRDVWDHEVWVSNRSYGPPIGIDPEILVVDELHGTSRHIALEHTAEVLHSVPLP